MTTNPHVCLAAARSQRLQDQISALRALSDDDFAEVDGSGLSPILVPVRAVFSDAQAPSASIRQ